MSKTAIGIAQVVVLVLLAPNNSEAQELGKKDDKKGNSVQSLVGVYYVKGTINAPTKKPYLGTAIINAQKETYKIEWRIGPDIFVGVGIRKDHFFGATWVIVKDGKLAAGSLLYKVEKGTKGPRLVGTWTGLPGSGVIHNETLTFLEPLGDLKKKKDENRINPK